MSLSTTLNPNRGPFKLEHDLTPRDFKTTYSRSTDGHNPSTQTHGQHINTHGNCGFARNNFETSYHRNVGDISLDLGQSPRENYGVPHHLDPYRPLVTGPRPKGFQYGSKEPNERQSNSRQIGRIATKTSAELSRFREQQAEAQYNIDHCKLERLHREQALVEEKKRDMEMLMKYDPWGKPGGGAPMNQTADKTERPTNRENKPPSRRADGKYNISCYEDLKAEYGDFNSYFGRPGNGAPIRTDSGKPKTELKGDEAIRFQEDRTIHQRLRYQMGDDKKQLYSAQLEDQLNEQKKREQDQRIENLQKEMEMLKHRGPYNRPGGGAPNKTRSEIEKAARSRANSDFVFHEPWGKGVGQPCRDAHGGVARHKNSDGHSNYIHIDPGLQNLGSTDPEMGVTLDLDSSRGGGGAPNKTNSGNDKIRKMITMRKSEIGHASVREDLPEYTNKRPSKIADDPENALYDPFGKPGGGAPNKDKEGHLICGRVKNDDQNTPGRRGAGQEYLNELQQEMQRQKKKQREFDQHFKDDNVGLADVMLQSQVGKPRRDPHTGLLKNQHLPRSDVTKEQTGERIIKNEKSIDYHTELEQASIQRKRVQELEKRKDNQQERHHQDQMNQFWNKPGGGAPNVKGTKMANLEDILYSPRKEKQYTLTTPFAVTREDSLFA